MKRIISLLLTIVLIWGCASQKQTLINHDRPEVMAWSNFNGIRLEGHLMEFQTSLRVVNPDWSETIETKKEVEQQKHRYQRDGTRQTVTAKLAPLDFAQIVEETAPGEATAKLKVTAEADTNIAGAYFCLKLPVEDFGGQKIELVNPAEGTQSEYMFPDTVSIKAEEWLRATASGFRFISPKKELLVSLTSPTEIVINNGLTIYQGNRNDDRKWARLDTTNFQVHLSILSGSVKKAQADSISFTIKVTGAVDKKPVELTLDAANPGQVFDGFGGNFRLQNPETDPPVIDYNLENLRVAWGRVEMPWFFWHMLEDVNPIEVAADSLHPRVDAAMKMAQHLSKMGIPVIASAWSAPGWAVVGDWRQAFRPQPGGLRGYALDKSKIDKIYESIAGYLLYMKQHYGVEAAMFSFNESDLGINVRHTPEEHAEFIKGLGKVLAEKGLATRLLLGDTSDANPVHFIKPAIADPDAVKYIGGVSFHSWRGCTNENLTQWGDAARELNVPLLIGEGSTDAAAWRYPQIFDEESFALYEINLYIRICAISQPKSILQWQLTSDYSLLYGGRIFRNNSEPMRPTQRFWNMKQLASTPEGAFALPITTESENINSAAFGNIARGEYAVHIVNNGAERIATLKGIPEGIKQLRIYFTDRAHGMLESDPIPVIYGTAHFILGAVGFTSLFGETD